VSRELLKKVTEAGMKKDVPDFRVGDTVDVACRISEGDKERIQVFSGTVIARRGSGISETFTVRRMVGNEGVERIFPLHSPKVASIEVTRGGKARRAKLYYLRHRIGKATRLEEAAGAEGEIESPAGEAAPAGAEPAESPEPAEATEATKPADRDETKPKRRKGSGKKE